MTRSHAFSRALRQPHVITSSFDWFNVLSVSYVIGQSNYFGFGFTTFKRKPLYIAVLDPDLEIRDGWGGGGGGGGQSPKKIFFLPSGLSLV